MKQILKNRVTILTLSVFFGFLGAQLPGRLTITKTGSVKYKFFWTLKADIAKITRGQYLRANKQLNLPQYKCNPCSIVKKAACMPGDRLSVKKGVYFCNNKFLCKASIRKDNFRFNGIVPNRHLFVIGDSKNSYDSRYFGFIKFEDIDALLIPIF